MISYVSRLESLRTQLDRYSIDGLVLSIYDTFALPRPNKSPLYWFSGFSSSNAILVVLRNTLLLCTDSRYLVAAEEHFTALSLAASCRTSDSQFVAQIEKIHRQDGEISSRFSCSILEFQHYHAIIERLKEGFPKSNSIECVQAFCDGQSNISLPIYDKFVLGFLGEYTPYSQWQYLDTLKKRCYAESLEIDILNIQYSDLRQTEISDINLTLQGSSASNIIYDCGYEKPQLISNEYAFVHPQIFAGIPTSKKLSIILKNLSDSLNNSQKDLNASGVYKNKESDSGKKNIEAVEKSSFLLLADLASIAWLLNIRAHDMSHSPLLCARLLIPIQPVVQKLFIVARPEALIELDFSPLEVARMPTIEDFFTIAPQCTIYTSYYDLSFAEVSHLSNFTTLYNVQNPCLFPKACKNPSELFGMALANLHDTVALYHFEEWLKQQALHRYTGNQNPVLHTDDTSVASSISHADLLCTEPVSCSMASNGKDSYNTPDWRLSEGEVLSFETRCAKQVTYYREQFPLFFINSFSPISAYEEHSAIPHYDCHQSAQSSINIIKNPIKKPIDSALNEFSNKVVECADIADDADDEQFICEQHLETMEKNEEDRVKETESSHSAEQISMRLRPFIYLLDSGGNYRCGTTDITRIFTFSANNGDNKQINRKFCAEFVEARTLYTAVLRGHIALAQTAFPFGTAGRSLDPIARQYLWNLGVDYGHSTGHGVGAFLNVHEGPQGISSMSEQILEQGMVVSIEPGFYKEGDYGFRIENLYFIGEYNPSLSYKELLRSIVLYYSLQDDLYNNDSDNDIIKARNNGDIVLPDKFISAELLDAIDKMPPYQIYSSRALRTLESIETLQNAQSTQDIAKERRTGESNTIQSDDFSSISKNAGFKNKSSSSINNESILSVAKRAEHRIKFLQFYPLTFVPIREDLIEDLDSAEWRWLKEYNEISDLLGRSEVLLKWLYSFRPNIL